MHEYCAHYGCTAPLAWPHHRYRRHRCGRRHRQPLAHPREPPRPRAPTAVPPPRLAAARGAVHRHCPGRGPRHQLGGDGYHLRKLESVGLVSDTGDGQGKQRLWQATSEQHSWNPSDFEGDEDSETALNWLTRDYARHFAEQYDRWLDVSTTWPTDWQDACGSSDASVLVTAEALEGLRSEMWDLIERYRRVGQGNPRARRVAVYAFAYPLDLDRPPSGGQR